MASRVWLGDLAVAWRALGRDDRGRAMIADLLGLAVADTQGAVADPATSVASEAVAVYQEPAMPYPLSSASASGAGSAVNDLPLLRPDSREPPPPMAWSAQSLSRTGAVALPRLGHEPLFPRRAAPAIIQAMLGRYTADGPLDADAAVARLATLDTLTSLPRQRRRTLRFGAQVLVDHSDSMRLFTQDQAELIRLIRGLLGERAEVLHFSLSPLQGVIRPRSRHHEPYRFPASGCTVLLISDFAAVPHPNAAAGASRWEWERFFALARHHRHALVGLIPYPQDRWPAWLDRQLPLITWDRGITAGDVVTRLR
jgi:hypothetical protein